MSNKSFTLIELLVVIVIIGILAGVIIVSVSSSINKANFAKAQSFSNTVQNELLGDLVSEWTFDIASNPGEDTWGNNDGTVSGATYVPRADGECVYGGCYEFDGTDDYIEVNGSNVPTSSLAITGEITLSAWVKFNNTGTSSVIIARGNALVGAGDYGYSIARYSLDNKLYFQTFNSSGDRDELASNFVFSDINWHYIVATWDGTINTDGKKIYLDGSLDNQRTSSISVIGKPIYNFTMGRKSSSASSYLKGLIDDVRIYNNVLSSSQIKQEYVAGLNSLLANNNISKEEYNLQIESLASK